jgi:hypothetical protein
VDGLLDVSDLRRVPRLDDQRLGVRHRERRKLVERRQVAVGLDPEVVEQRRAGAARAHASELAGQEIDGGLHLGLEVLDDRLHGFTPWAAWRRW